MNDLYLYQLCGVKCYILVEHLRSVLLGRFKTLEPLALLYQKVQSPYDVHISQLFSSTLLSQPLLVSIIYIFLIAKQLKQINQCKPKCDIGLYLVYHYEETITLMATLRFIAGWGKPLRYRTHNE